ncbi:MAG: cyanophycin synthetase [Dysosmobacter sp.]
MRVIQLPEERCILDDCYNANPQSVSAALEILARTECDRKVAVLGDMGELGDLTAQAHYNMGALAAMLGIDFVAAIGEKAAMIADGAVESGGEAYHFRHQGGGHPGTGRSAGAQYRHAGQGIPRHAL